MKILKKLFRLSFSQHKQDKYLVKNIFKGYKNGFFMDVGAHDGITFNNTMYFELNHNWQGINIEPIKEVYDKLQQNRPKSINLNCAVSDVNGTAKFICNTGYTEMLSGLKNQYDARHYDRLNKEIDQMGGTTEEIVVNTKTMESICDEHNIKNINYLSIDVEGAELNVVKSINFSKVFIDVISFENNYNDVSAPILELLKEKGYIMVHKYFDVFMVHTDSRFAS